MNCLRSGMAIVSLALIGCQAGFSYPRARVQDEGATYLYVQPFSQEAERLHVSIGGIAAIRGDGREIPLSVSLPELGARTVTRQRLLAVGPLPAGDYSGFAFRTRRATLSGEEGEAVLLVPEAPSRIDFAFSVRSGEASVIAVALRHAEAVEAGFRFGAAFSLYYPDRPAPGRMGFVANGRSNDITVFDKKSLEVFAVIATGRGPSGMALDQRARKIYVALSGEDAVDVVDVLSGRVTDRIRLTPGDEPVAVALTPDGRILLSANRGSNTVSVIDPIARAESTKIPVGSDPRSIVVDHAGRRAFTFNALASTVSAIDISTRSVVRSIPTDPAPVRGAFNRAGDRLYTIHATAPYVTVINPATLSVAARFPVRSGMVSIKPDPGTDLVYLGGRADFGAGVHEPFSFATVDFLDTGSAIAHMGTDGDENLLYMASEETNRVMVFYRIRRNPAGALDVGDGPSWISVMGEN